MYLDPNPRPPAGDLGAFFRGVPGARHERVLPLLPHRRGNAETVPWTGLEATTRAYAKIIDEVNKLPLSDLQRPEEPAPLASEMTMRETVVAVFDVTAPTVAPGQHYPDVE